MTRARGPRSILRHLPLDLFCAAAVAAAIAGGLRGPGALEGASGRAARMAGRPAPADTDLVVQAPVDPPLYRDSLLEPLVVRSVDGVLTATLVVEMATLPVPTDSTPTPLTLRAFRLASTTDPAYRRNDPRFTPRFPGPTFRVKRGDLVRIRLINNLPRPTPSQSNEVCVQPVPDSVQFSVITIPDVYQACFHGFNYTNIHYHGMHVTPDSTSSVVGDDVLMAIAPGDTLQYSFRIPDNQSPGTHWYHPHKHGSVAIQVANGMAGAFVVEDPRMGLDSIVRTLRMQEHLIAIQQVAERMGLIGHQGELDKSAILVNGQFRPTLYMAPGEVQRWRIVSENATDAVKTFGVEFVDLPGQDEPGLYDVARDGVQFAPQNYDAVHPDTSLQMAPGQRLDVFVRAPRTPGRHQFQLRHVPAVGRRARNATIPVDSTLDGNPAATATVLFDVVVDPALSGRNTTLPATLPPQPAFLRGRLPEARHRAVVVFTDSLNQQPSQFYLGSSLNPFQRYDDNAVFVPSDTSGNDMPMVLGQTQTWKIINDSEQQINHPFHIHINPFQVNRVVFPLGTSDPFYALYQQLNDAAERGHPIWLDVLPLPLPRSDTTYQRTASGVDTVVTRVEAHAVITQRYDPFEGCRGGNCGPPTGYFVMHCHILGHEERGMMQVLQVVEPGQPVSPPESHVSGHGAHHPAPGGQGARRRDPPNRPRP